ncbi:cellulose synthase/poly-beta-1,6-N-acetylglucosamine synthase-like glycosyltransferase [Blastococcus colisei]|uniref:Cellulose synthase/poly-beta-1,6-N-acetylglucosamine synthase-like glycosyltransferase n=1 Tax=Blastococcus colisei TaxID=1564162 RepID=A0A543PJM2_9ACTN|nr:glycosyltransferase [Blastococcus colisei]TQN44271.1 cellulose synthase/poly-beta-1,6-N-acetylglucosamine synthase-like glycosyltransferase [Blastococcus colisei]
MLAELSTELLVVLGVAGLGYTVALQAVMLLLSASAAVSLARLGPSRRSGRLAELRRTADPAPVTVVVPAYNEGPVIVPAVTSLLALDYPALQVVVVNDGSTDDTLERLVTAFDLLPTQLPPEAFAALPGRPVRAVWQPCRRGIPLRVVDKEAGGSKADAINVGVSLADTPLIVVGDGDGLVEPQALARAVAALRDHRGDPVAVGGTILPVNDCEVSAGQVVRPRVPRNFLAACQLLEYLRSFVVGKAGMGALASVTLVSGAFGLFRTEELRRVGGFAVGHLGEDLDITIRLVQQAMDAGRDMPGGPVLQVPEAVLWTEVPETLRVLGRQRIRWHRGLITCLRDHWRLIGNPRYRGFGLLGMTYLTAFELLAPLMEAIGYLTLVAAAATGALDLVVAAAVAGCALLAGWLTTGVAVYLQERRFGRYRDTADLARLFLVALAEPFLYRPLTLWWRLRALAPGSTQWGAMPRKGFVEAT